MAVIGYIQENDDLKICSGTFCKGDVSQDIIEDTLMAVPGNYKNAPLIGIAIEGMINSTFEPFLPNKIKEQLSQQGIETKQINIDSDGVSIEL